MAESLFSLRQEIAPPLRRIAAMILPALVVAGLCLLLWQSRGRPEQPERLVVSVVILGLLGGAGLEARSAWRRISESRSRLAELAGKGWPALAGDPAAAGGSFADRVAQETLALAPAGPAGPAGEEVAPGVAPPGPRELVAPVRAEADQATLVLRWAPPTALMVGVLGALYGLILASEGALSALGKGGSAALLAGSALPPLQFSFFAAAAGVAASLGLGLLRLVCQGDAEAHFAQLTSELSRHLHGRSSAWWQAPAAQLADSARHLDGLGQDLKQLSVEISQSNIHASSVLEGTAGVIRDQLLPLPGELSTALRAGLRESVEAALARISKPQERLGRQPDQLVQRLELVGRHLDETLESVAALAEKTGRDWHDAIAQGRAALEGLAGRAQDIARTEGQALKDTSIQTVQAVTGVSKYIESTSMQIRELFMGAKAAVDELRRIRQGLEGFSAKLAEHERNSHESAERLQILNENLEMMTQILVDQNKVLGRFMTLNRADQSSLLASLDRVHRAMEKLGQTAKKF